MRHKLYREAIASGKAAMPKAVENESKEEDKSQTSTTTSPVADSVGSTDNKAVEEPTEIGEGPGQDVIKGV